MSEGVGTLAKQPIAGKSDALSGLQLAAAKAPWQEPDSDEARRKVCRRLYEHFAVSKDGALKLLDEAEVSRQRGVVWEMIKEVGNSLLDGRELVNISLPITLFEPKSFLEKICEGWAYAPNFLTRAAQCTNPLERFKLTMAFLVAGIHLTPTYRKPFNPVIGETYQAKLADGTAIFCEQSTHHPPASNFQLVGPNNLYHFYGRGVGSASARGNSLRGYQYGMNTAEFSDGTKISWTLPILVITGALWGERTQYYEGSINFRDEKNDLACDLCFNAEGQGFLKSLFSKQKQTVSYMRGEIVRLSDKKRKEVLGIVEGSWLTHLDVDGVRYWDDEKDLPWIITPVDNPLPSDCRFREDLIALLEGDIERGKECKLMLEERQRYDERLRSAAAKTRPKKDGKKRIELVVVPAAATSTSTVTPSALTATSASPRSSSNGTCILTLTPMTTPTLTAVAAANGSGGSSIATGGGNDSETPVRKESSKKKHAGSNAKSSS